MIREIVDSYLDILPEDASRIQLKETERAFVAGMLAWRSLVINIVSQKASIEIMETELARAEQELNIEIKKIKERMNEKVS